MVRELGGDGRGGPGSATDPDGPVGLAEPLGVELADHSQDSTVEQTPIATGDGLLGGSENLSQAAERGSGVDIERLDDPSVQLIDLSGFHTHDLIQWR